MKIIGTILTIGSILGVCAFIGISPVAVMYLIASSVISIMSVKLTGAF